MINQCQILFSRITSSNGLTGHIYLRIWFTLLEVHESYYLTKTLVFLKNDAEPCSEPCQISMIELFGGKLLMSSTANYFCKRTPFWMFDTPVVWIAIFLQSESFLKSAKLNSLNSPKTSKTSLDKITKSLFCLSTLSQSKTVLSGYRHNQCQQVLI